jgi:hypothetical protein
MMGFRTRGWAVSGRLAFPAGQFKQLSQMPGILSLAAEPRAEIRIAEAAVTDLAHAIQNLLLSVFLKRSMQR